MSTGEPEGQAEQQAPEAVETTAEAGESILEVEERIPGVFHRIVPGQHMKLEDGSQSTIGNLHKLIFSYDPYMDDWYDEAAQRYAASLPDRFDVVHLGVGSDGHTASWAPAPHPDALDPQKSAGIVRAIEEVLAEKAR